MYNIWCASTLLMRKEAHYIVLTPTNALLHILTEIPKIEPWNWKRSLWRNLFQARTVPTPMTRRFAHLFLWNYWRQTQFSLRCDIVILSKKLSICTYLQIYYSKDRYSHIVTKKLKKILTGYLNHSTSI